MGARYDLQLAEKALHLSPLPPGKKSMDRQAQCRPTQTLPWRNWQTLRDLSLGPKGVRVRLARGAQNSVTVSQQPKQEPMRQRK